MEAVANYPSVFPATMLRTLRVAARRLAQPAQVAAAAAPACLCRPPAGALPVALGAHASSSSGFATSLRRLPLPAARPTYAAAQPLWLAAQSAPQLHAALAVGGARRWQQRGRHRQGGAHAQPYRKSKPKVGTKTKGTLKFGATTSGHRMRRPANKYKLKSHKGALKRFFRHHDGTWIHKAAGTMHLQANKSRHRQTLRKRRYVVVKTRGIIRKLERLLPYGTTLQMPPNHKTPLLWQRPDGWTEAAGFGRKGRQEAESSA